MSTPGKYTIRDYQVDALLQKVYVPALEVVRAVASTSWVGLGSSTASLAAGWSIGSPSYGVIPGGRHGGIFFTALTSTIDYVWRVPSSVDKNQPIYFKHHWTSSISGLTPTIGFTQVVATMSSGSSMVSSPTAVLNTLIPASSNTGAAGTAWSYNLTGHGAIRPIATGLAAYQVMGDAVEAIHMAISPASTNWTIGPNNVVWLGMDIEYTPRRTFGDGSRREARKLETNLGYQEKSSTSDY